MITSWDTAKKKKLTRNDSISGREITLEPGVNFFVEALERAGAKVRFTCEGHPTGFSIVFDAKYSLALAIIQSGYFDISMMRQRNRWHLHLNGNENGARCVHGKFNHHDRNRILRAACKSWEKSSWFVS